MKALTLYKNLVGSPGMSGRKTESFTIYALSDGQP